MAAMTLGEIAENLGGDLHGDASLVIESVRAPEHAGEGTIAVVYDRRFAVHLENSAAGALVIPRGWECRRGNLIRVDEGRSALARLLAMFDEPPALTAGIESGAHVAASARFGRDVYVAAGASVGEHVVVGDRVRILANAVIGDGTSIGDGCVIHPNVTIYPRMRIGRRVFIHAGTVIGSDGFGYVPAGNGIQKIPQIGSVEIEDDVEIGANCTIDRATVEVTRIGAGSKIDDLVHIAHNCDVGRNSIIVAQVGIAGSVVIGDGAMLGGQAGVAEHVRIGPRVMIGAQAGVHSDIASGEWLGTPALPRERFGRMAAMMPHLPEYRDRVRALEERAAALEKLIEELHPRESSERKP